VLQSQEMNELKEMIEAVDKKVNTIMAALLRCQTRCYVDNPRVADPPGRWRGLGRALMALVKF